MPRRAVSGSAVVPTAKFRKPAAFPLASLTTSIEGTSVDGRGNRLRVAPPCPIRHSMSRKPQEAVAAPCAARKDCFLNCIICRISINLDWGESVELSGSSTAGYDTARVRMSSGIVTRLGRTIKIQPDALIILSRHAAGSDFPSTIPLTCSPP